MRQINMALIVIGSWCLSAISLASTPPKVLINNCRVDSVFGVELNRLKKDESKIINECFKKNGPNSYGLCVSDFDLYTSRLSSLQALSQEFIDKYDWVHAQYLIEPDQGGYGLKATITSTIEWPFDKITNPLITKSLSATNFAGGGYRDQTRPGLKGDYQGYYVKISPTSVGFEDISIRILKSTKTSAQTAVVWHQNNGAYFERKGFECEVHYFY